MRPAVSLAHSPEVAAAFEGLDVEELQYCSEVEDPAGPSSSGTGSSTGTISQVWVPLRLVRQPEAPSQQQQRRQRLPVAVLLHATGVDMGSLVAQQAAFARRGYLAATIDCRSVAAGGAPRSVCGKTRRCRLCWLHLISLQQLEMPVFKHLPPRLLLLLQVSRRPQYGRGTHLGGLPAGTSQVSCWPASDDPCPSASSNQMHGTARLCPCTACAQFDLSAFHTNLNFPPYSYTACTVPPQGVAGQR